MDSLNVPLNPDGTRTIAEFVILAVGENHIQFAQALLEHEHIVHVEVRSQIDRELTLLAFVKKGHEEEVMIYLANIDESKPLRDCVVRRVMNNGLIM